MNKLVIIIIVLFIIFLVYQNLNNNETFVGTNNNFSEDPKLVINNKYVKIGYGGEAINYPNYSNYYELTSDQRLGIIDENTLDNNKYYQNIKIFVGKEKTDKYTLLQDWIIQSPSPVNLKDPVQIKCKNKDLYLNCSDKGTVYVSNNLDENPNWNLIPSTEGLGKENGFYYIQNTNTKKYITFIPSNSKTTYISSEDYTYDNSPKNIDYDLIKMTDEKTPWFIAPETPLFTNAGKGTYNNTLNEAKEYCQNQNMRVCSVNELNSYANMGVSSCAYAWTMSKNGNKNVIAYPMSYKASGCGNSKGVIYGNLSKANISCCPIQHSTNPCFTSTYKTGPHSEECLQNLWKQSGCSIDGYEYIKNNTPIYKKWQSMSIPDIEKNMEEINKNSLNSKCSGLPGGDWINKARNYKVSSNLLTAELKNHNGIWNKRSVNFVNGQTFSVNADGYFACSSHCEIVKGELRSGRGLYFFNLSGGVNYSLQVSTDNGLNWKEFAKYLLSVCLMNSGRCNMKPEWTNFSILTSGGWWSCVTKDGLQSCSGVIYAKSGDINSFQFRAKPINKIINSDDPNCKDCSNYQKCYGNPFKNNDNSGKSNCLKQMWVSYGCTKDGTQYPTKIDESSIFYNEDLKQSQVIMNQLQSANSPKDLLKYNNYDFENIEKCQGESKVNEIKSEIESLKKKQEEVRLKAEEEARLKAEEEARFQKMQKEKCFDPNFKYLSKGKLDENNICYSTQEYANKGTGPREDWCCSDPNKSTTGGCNIEMDPEGTEKNKCNPCYKKVDDWCKKKSGGSEYAYGRFLPGLASQGQSTPEWRCYTKESLTPDLMNFNNKSPKYWTNPELKSVWDKCYEDNYKKVKSCRNPLANQDLQCVDLKNYLRKSSGLGANGGETQNSLNNCTSWVGEGGKWIKDYNNTCSAVEFNKPFYVRNMAGVKPYMGSCGYSRVCTSQLAVGSYKPTNSYVTKYPKWSTWILKNKDSSSNRKVIHFNDIVTIQLFANNWYLITCGLNRCNSGSYLSVSCTSSPNSYNNEQYWKVISPTGKTGQISVNDEIKLLNLWGQNSYLNTCWWSSDCGSGKYFAISTTRKNSSDSRGYTSNWKFDFNI